jgi:hypothetical protein
MLISNGMAKLSRNLNQQSGTTYRPCAAPVQQYHTDIVPAGFSKALRKHFSAFLLLIPAQYSKDHKHVQDPICKNRQIMVPAKGIPIRSPCQLQQLLQSATHKHIECAAHDVLCVIQGQKIQGTF